MVTIVETTDAPTATATPYAMAAGDVFYGTLSQNATDWVAVTLVAGQTYSFGAVGLGAAGSGVTDPLLRLRGSDGVSIVHNDDAGPGFCAALTYTATTSGTYYLEVRAMSAAPDGSYGLVMNLGADLSYAVDLGAAVLYRDGSTWADTPATGVTVTWGVRATGPALDASENSAPFQVLTAAQIATATAALANYSDIANIVFDRVAPNGTTNAATILIGGYASTTDGAGAFANYPGDTAAGDVAGDIWINNTHVSGTSLPIGGYAHFVFLHEMGHALGLAHPGDYNAKPGVTITYNASAQFIQDSQQFTVMSYFDATATEADMPDSYPDTLMMYDIYALQQMYGVNHTARAGNDTYGFDATLPGGAYDFTTNTDPLLCIWDGAGTDTLNLSGFGGIQRIDLNGGAFSDVGGFKGNLSIAVGAVIENAVGGRGGDILLGNAAANWLRGGKGADVLTGGAGNDRLSGNAGADDFVFSLGSGSDRVTDFNRTVDGITLSADLWGGAVKTAAQVLDEYASLRGGNLVLDFGADQVILAGVSTLTGMDSHILLT